MYLPWVNRRQLESGQRVTLQRGDVIEIGDPSQRWTLIDDSPPSIVAVSENGDLQLCGQAGLLALPDPDDPRLVIFHDRQGNWVMEDMDGCDVVVDGQRVSIGDQGFVLHVPDPLTPTLDASDLKATIDTISLHFSVSRDEEYVELVAVHGQNRIELGARSHHYLLLVLARARLGDEALPPGEQGWLYQDQLAAQVGMNERYLNVHVFRCRQQFGAAGIEGAACIVERRKQTRQLRLGISRIAIDSP